MPVHPDSSRAPAERGADAPAGAPDAGRAAVRRFYRLAAYALLAFIVCGSLVPFRFEARELPAAFDAFLGLGAAVPGGRSLEDWLINLVLYAPLAFAWMGALARADAPGRGLGAAWVVVTGCAAVSFAVEFAQVFIPVRTSSWVDFASNGAGAAAGAVAWALAGGTVNTWLQWLIAPQVLPSRPRLARFAAMAALPYAVTLVWANGWLSRDWLGIGHALARADATGWLPFLRHHDAGIVAAVASSVAYALLYAPAGALWLCRALRRTQPRPFDLLRPAALSTAAAAAAFEASKLFLAGGQPDTGNIVIAALGAAAGWMAAYRVVAAGGVSPAALPASPPRPRSEPGPQPEPVAVAGSGIAMRAAALLLAVGTLAALAAYPWAAPALAAGLLAYAALLWVCGGAWLVVLPALLPVLDLTPWTGWYFLTEFDLFVAVTLAVGYWRRAGTPVYAPLPGSLKAALAALGASYLASLAIGVTPLPPLDHAAFSHPFSRYAALLPAKAFFGTLALVPLLRREFGRGTEVTRLFTAGMLAGLLGVSLIALWERFAYPGLFDFSSIYRVAASFSSMNTGGGHVEAYLVLALPFVVAGMHFFRGTALRAGLAGLFVLGCYALMVTFARAGYAGLALALAVLIAASAFPLLSRRGRDPGALVVPAVLLALAATIAVPVASGRFAQSRFATISADWGVRMSHWQEILAMMDRGWVTQLFGMGLGRFPETYFFQGTGAKPSAPFRYHTEAGNTFLRFGTGAPLYTDQIVPVAPRRRYVVSLDARSTRPKAVVHVLLCERTYFYSAGCESAVMRLGDAAGAWSRYTAELDSGTLGGTPWYAYRPVKLSLENASADAAVDIDNVRLAAPDGRNLVENGDFSRGGARWYFSSAFNHLPWHIKNLPLEIYFGQGLFGLAAFAALAVVAGIGIGRQALHGDRFSAVALAALTGFVAIGWFDSLIDSPRLITLALLIVLVSAPALRLERAPVRARGVAPGAEDRPAPPPRSTQPGQPAGAPRVPRVWRPDLPWVHALAGIMLCAALAWIVLRLPGVPYNLRELPNPSRPNLALVGLAAVLYWSAGLPAWIAAWMGRGGTRPWLYPAAALLHGLGAWLVLYFTVLPESFHDVVGNPVLGWPWEWERMGRFVALFAVPSLMITGAVLAAASVHREPLARAAPAWLLTCALLLPVSYWVIVPMAATDNLTELIAGRGAAGAALLLAAWFFVVGFAGSLIAAWLAGRGGMAIGKVLLIALATVPVAWFLLGWGTESTIIKDGRMFSALQFLLSTDRRNLAAGADLGVRYVLLHLGVTGAIALAQYPFWLYAGRRRASSR